MTKDSESVKIKHRREKVSRIYIDFDSTLYNTDKLRNFTDLVIDALCKKTDAKKTEVQDKVALFFKVQGTRRIFDLCLFLENEYGLENGCLRVVVENVLESGYEFMFNDSIPFLERLALKGHEINILTYTNKEFDYQMLKLMGSKVIKYVDNFIICSKHKGDLFLDFKNGIFIDDNPEELKSLFNTGVSPDRLIRMRRIGAGYSKIDMDIPVTEVLSFDEIIDI